MERETPVAEDIRITGENARCDEACKRLLSTKEILAHILKACVEEYRDCDVRDIAGKYIEGQPEVSEVPVMPDETNAPRVRGLSDTDKTLTEGTVTYDIRFMASAPATGEPIRLIVNIEAQKNYRTGYPLIKRGIYYCSRMISAQYGTEFVKSNYQNVRKVYSIWICLDVPKEWENTITRYHIVEENLVGHAREQIKNYDLLTAVLVGLGKPDGENYDGVLKMLGALFSGENSITEKKRILEQDFDIPMTETLERRLSEMCNLSQGFEERGMKRGFEKGRIEGRAEGRTEGRIESTISTIRNLMGSMGWTLEQVMDAMQLPEADRPKYAEMMKTQ